MNELDWARSIKKEENRHITIGKGGGEDLDLEEELLRP
jgi:hypothetical protein